jgi:hypothetical protein
MLAGELYSANDPQRVAEDQRRAGTAPLLFILLRHVTRSVGLDRFYNRWLYLSQANEGADLVILEIIQRRPKNIALKLLRKSVSDNFSILAYGL